MESTYFVDVQRRLVSHAARKVAGVHHQREVSILGIPSDEKVAATVHNEAAREASGSSRGSTMCRDRPRRAVFIAPTDTEASRRRPRRSLGQRKPRNLRASLSGETGTRTRDTMIFSPKPLARCCSPSPLIGGRIHHT